MSKLTKRQLDKISDSELTDLIYATRGSSSIQFSVFYVNGEPLGYEEFANTFGVNPEHIRYVYEILDIASAHDILNHLRVKHYEGAFGVCTMVQLRRRTNNKLSVEQIENLLNLGKSPSDIVVNFSRYFSKYKRNEIPVGETSLFA